MRRSFWGFALALLASACGSDSQDGPTGDSSLTLSVLPAEGITLSEVSAYQSLKVPLAIDGAPAGAGTVPLVAHRDALVRVHVTTEPGWKQKTLKARLKVETRTPTGTLSKVFETSRTVSGSSSDDALDSTLNFEIPGEYIRPDSTFAVVVFDPQKSGSAPKTSPARYPRENGEVAQLDAKEGGQRLRIRVVPVRYNRDGGRLPDTSDEQLEIYRDRMYRLYPAAQVEIDVREPFDWDGIITGSSGFEQLLNAIQALRNDDQAEADVYYYGAFMPTPDFGSFCGSGCTTGLSMVNVGASVGIGYPGEASANTMAHEVGHAHGLGHAPCGGAGGPDPEFPYDDGGIGTWGYDAVDKRLIDPGDSYKDMMGYCSPDWISDYHYAKLFARVRRDNGVEADRVILPPGRYRQVWIGSDGSTRLGEPVAIEGVREGEVRAVEFFDDRGASIERKDAVFYPYDHLPGGLMLLPEEPVVATRVTVHDRAGRAQTITLRPSR